MPKTQPSQLANTLPPCRARAASARALVRRRYARQARQAARLAAGVPVRRLTALQARARGAARALVSALASCCGRLALKGALLDSGLLDKVRHQVVLSAAARPAQAQPLCSFGQQPQALLKRVQAQDERDEMRERDCGSIKWRGMPWSAPSALPFRCHTKERRRDCDESRDFERKGWQPCWLWGPRI